MDLVPYSYFNYTHMSRFLLFGTAFLLVVGACTPEIVPIETNEEEVEPFFCGIGGVENVNVYHKDDKIYLYGANDLSTHFEVTNFALEFTQLKEYGYDRETFKALTHPEYQPVHELAGRYATSEKVIILETEEGFKVYPYTLMTYHEVINEVVNGEPVMIAYCFLADLAAVYSRDYCGNTITFAVSGYTYSDSQIWDGKDGFVLWDRDTESLWWPLINRAVSGEMKNTMLETYEEDLWSLSTFGEVLDQYPNALILSENNPWSPPVDFPRLEKEDLSCK